VSIVIGGVFGCPADDTGFDGTVMSSVNSMVQFRTFFDINLEGDNKTSLLFVSDI
jgi:hypothetical protein